MVIAVSWDVCCDCYCRWQLGSSGLHSRNESQQIQEAWNYTLTVGPQGVSQILATAAQGNITATYMASLNVTLSSGAVISVPVSGIYQGLSVSPVVRSLNYQRLHSANKCHANLPIMRKLLYSQDMVFTSFYDIFGSSLCNQALALSCWAPQKGLLAPFALAAINVARNDHRRATALKILMLGQARPD